jgi:tRNA(adenine34) deaminase
MLEYEEIMQIAIDFAKKNSQNGEVPVAAIITDNKAKIIAISGNSTQSQIPPNINITAHAEINAINTACNILGTKYLTDCTLYVTLEPCIMCAGAIIKSRLKRLVYGAFDTKNGVCNSNFNIFQQQNHSIFIRSSILQQQCSSLLTNFFRAEE